MNKIELSKYLATGFCGRDINEIIVHCTATKPNVRADVVTIDGWHKARGFKCQKGSGHYCGYHFVVAQDGTKGRQGGRQAPPYNYTKATGTNRVRPVSTFIQ